METYSSKWKSFFLEENLIKEPEKYVHISASELIAAIYSLLMFYSECIISPML